MSFFHSSSFTSLLLPMLQLFFLSSYSFWQEPPLPTHSFLAISILPPLSATLSCMYSFTLSFHQTTSSPPRFTVSLIYFLHKFFSLSLHIIFLSFIAREKDVNLLSHSTGDRYISLPYSASCHKQTYKIPIVIGLPNELFTRWLLNVTLTLWKFVTPTFWDENFQAAPP